MEMYGSGLPEVTGVLGRLPSPRKVSSTVM